MGWFGAKESEIGSRIETSDLNSGPPRSMEKRLPNHTEIEMSSFLAWKLLFSALDQFRIDFGGLQCELRAWYVGSIKVIRRR